MLSRKVTRRFTSLWLACRRFLAPDESQILVLPLPPRDMVRPEDMVDPRRIQGLQSLEERTVKHLRLRASRVRALRILPYPADAFVSAVQFPYDDDICTDVFSYLVRATELRFLQYGHRPRR